MQLSLLQNFSIKELDLPCSANHKIASGFNDKQQVLE